MRQHQCGSHSSGPAAERKLVRRHQREQFRAEMTIRLQTYEAPGITVTFDPTACIHSAVCIRGLPAVFDVRRKRWIDTSAAEADAIAAQVERCPSGALQHRRTAS
jgi:uncharacterized Fe-S cluster protein YjdI